MTDADPFRTACAPLDFGADGEGTHADTEYVDLASLDRILTGTVIEFCS